MELLETLELILDDSLITRNTLILSHLRILNHPNLKITIRSDICELNIFLNGNVTKRVKLTSTCNKEMIETKS